MKFHSRLAAAYPGFEDNELFISWWSAPNDALDGLAPKEADMKDVDELVSKMVTVASSKGAE